MSEQDSTAKTRSGYSMLNVANPFVAGITGFALGLLLCWFSMVRPMYSTIEAREASIREWERINRQEREAIADIKTISIEELRHWVSTLETQNSQYANLVSRLHEQEKQLIGPSSTHLWVAVIAILGVACLGAWVIRDSNADAARTLYNAVAVLPSLSEALQENRLVLEATQSTRLAQLSLSNPDPKRIAAVTGRRSGTVKTYFESKGYGFILDQDGTDVFFHLKSVSRLEGAGHVSVGAKVSFVFGEDSSGRRLAMDVHVVPE